MSDDTQKYDDEGEDISPTCQCPLCKGECDGSSTDEVDGVARCELCAVVLDGKCGYQLGPEGLLVLQSDPEARKRAQVFSSEG